MKRRFMFTISLVIIFITTNVYSQKADIIIVNARVSTFDSINREAEAVAIAGNRILMVGTHNGVMKFKGKDTKLVDAKKRRVIPGLFDSHLHVIRAGRFYNSELRWDGVRSLRRALEMLSEQAKRTPAGQWVRVVGGWSEYQFSEKRMPTIEEINAATGDVPAFILYLYGKAWLNKSGLKKLGINADSPGIPGGLIEKDEWGEPTGLLIAEPNAFLLYSTLSRLPELRFEEQINSTLKFMSELNRLGVTGAMDAGGGFQNFPDDYLITDSLARVGLLTVRLPYYLFAQKRGTELNDFSIWTGMVSTRNPGNSGMGINDMDYAVHGGGENLVGDAGDFENFLYPRPALSEGMEQHLGAVIELLVKQRWPFRLHATYDESITRDLDVIEKINSKIPLKGLPWFIDHAETISEKSMHRIKALGGGIAIQHRMAYQGENFIRRYGKKAAQTAPPIKKMINLGIPVGLGTDGTRVASYNPWVALYWITTGKTIGGNNVLGKDNVLDRATAMKLLTSGGYELIHERKKGKLLTGYYADLVILDKDYFTIQDDQIPSIVSLLTIVDGKIVYGAGEYRDIAPTVPPAIPAWSPVNYFGGYQYK